MSLQGLMREDVVHQFEKRCKTVCRGKRPFACAYFVTPLRFLQAKKSADRSRC
ncbi:hypothetical protein [Okeania sp. KiyG1]|uniref:hypothetical protein n=1 Tax=Okeania sp. KiyG1 TaxID=2720165 RepID=UPI001921B21D|nr:hypothetical protein [Okeania sp. KiyG1]